MADQNENAKEKPVNPFEIFTPLGKKIVKALKASDYETLEDLAAAKDSDIIAIKGIGQRALEPIIGILVDEGHEHEVEVTKVPENIKPIENKKPSPVAKLKKALGGGIHSRVNIAFPVWPLLQRGKKPTGNEKSYNISYGQEITVGDAPDEYPQDLVDTMLERGEAAIGAAPVIK